MGEIFDKRMKLLMKDGSPGMAFVNRTNLIENKTFKNDQNYRNGMLYDWEMNEIEKVDFKFEKIKTFSVSGYEVEYMIHFRPDFNIESRYKDLFFKKDGRERLGFYIDVYDYSKKKYEKWMIVGKDDRVAFDRYNALKCNWCLEWLDGTKYRRCVCVVRDAFYKTMNTPTSKVEEFFSKYQNMDDDVATQLDQVLKDDTTMSDEQKEKYRALMEKQYQNLSYKIEDETINGYNATVDVEIKVLDYATTINNAKKYYEEHKDEIENENKENKEDNTNVVEDAIDDAGTAIKESSAYIDYKLKELESVSDTTTYTITFYLTKEDGKWQLQDISDLDLQKIHGLYEG